MSDLRVGFWTAHLAGPVSTGVRVYTSQFASALARRVSLTELAAPGSNGHGGTNLVPVARWRLNPAWCRWALPSLVDGLRLDVVHFPFFPPFVPSGRWRARKVVTVHGTAGAQLPERVGDAALAARAHRARETLTQDYHLIVTSAEAAKQEICDCYDVPPDRVCVVPCGVADQFFERAPAGPLPVPRPFLLCVSQLRRKKNVHRLVRAFGRAVREGVPHHLVLVGSAADGADDVQAAIAASPAPARVHWLGSVSCDILLSLYRGADLVVHPSLHEGFGLPVAEAMAAERPVACADLPVLREVARDAATYFDPRNESAIAAAIAGLLSDPQRRAEQVRRGRDLAAQFTWSAAADRLCAVYRLVTQTSVIRSAA